MIGGYNAESAMSILQAYLHNPRTQRVLSRKPGEKGFSLIELVVVVAVLAILAAIAIPSFTSISQEARVAGAKTALANLAKECAVKLVGSNPDKTYIMPTVDTYTLSVVTDTGTAGPCGTSDIYQAADSTGGLATFTYNTQTGEKACSAGSNGQSTDRMLGCTGANANSTTGIR